MAALGQPDLYRTTLPEHFLEVAAGHGVTHTVVVEASSWLEDNQWILDLADDAELTGTRDRRARGQYSQR